MLKIGACIMDQLAEKTCYWIHLIQDTAGVNITISASAL